MVYISDCNSEIGAHLLKEICHLICVWRFLSSKAVQKFEGKKIIKKTFLPSHVRTYLTSKNYGSGAMVTEFPSRTHDLL